MSQMDRLSEEKEQLELAVKELKVLNEVATAISSVQGVDEIINQIVLKCIKHLDVEEGTVSLLERKNKLDEFHTMVRKKGSSADKMPLQLDARLKGWMLKNRALLMSNNIYEDERFSYSAAEGVFFRSILCVPLIVKGELIGYLAVFNKKGNKPFTDQDRRVLSIIGSQSAQVIENARLYEEEKELLQLQEELRMAWDIQLKLLPDRTPTVEGYDVQAANIPAKEVGGDYYDFLLRDEKSIGFCIGDITGKGMPAAMLMANLQATLRSQATIFDDCDKCLYGVNNLLFRSTEATKFATLFLGVLNKETGSFTYANGGHDAPVLFRRDGEMATLDATGLLVGVMENAEYAQNTVSLEKGDLLLLYSDGANEAMNTEGEEFGLERLLDLVKENRHASSAQLVNLILAELKGHSAGVPQSDDITLMIIKRESDLDAD